MAKILLVEDDKSLREIYGVRLMAEGYEIVSAGDGEEALAMAIKERPDLIVSDVMMPKISGFDMLDILRSTTETKDVKVIMMTALSSDDQRARGEALGADRYLVKSQVGIEDVVRTVHDVLGDAIAQPVAAPTLGPSGPAPVAAAAASTVAPTPESVSNPAPTPITPPAPATPAEPIVPAAPVAPSGPAPTIGVPPLNPVYTTPAEPAAPVTPVAPVTPAPVTPTPEPVVAAPVAAPVAPTSSAPASVTLNELPPAPAPAPAPAPNPTPPAPASVSGLPQPTAPFSSPAPASLGERVIEPLSNSPVNQAQNDIASQIQQALNNDQTPGQVPPAA